MDTPVVCLLGGGRQFSAPVGGKEGLFGVLFLGFQCIAWLVLMVEEMLHNPDVKDFIKSFREDLKVLIVRRGVHKTSRYLEVAAYTLGGQKGLILLPNCHEGLGWSQVVGELSKAMAFLEATVVLPPSRRLGRRLSLV